MQLVGLVRKETGADFPEIMLLRHFNTIEKLARRGGSVEEFTLLQPTGSKWDFWAEGKPRINIVVVIVHDLVDNVYRVTGIEAEGPAISLLSDVHRQFDIDRKKWNPDLPTRRFAVVRVPFSAKGATITGWKGREISPVLRSKGKLFWKIEVNVPETVRLAEEVTEHEKLYEGSVCRVTINAYERNPEARSRCIAHYGPKCVVCGFDFGAIYGPIAQGLIHVHHIKPLCEVGERYEVDPIDDLRPICPNCHAVIHFGDACRSIDEVRQMRCRSSA